MAAGAKLLSRSIRVTVMERIQDLMATQSPQARREVELTNIPVVAAQAERFRQRLGFWTARVRELE
jgi:hypothetical protein